MSPNYEIPFNFAETDELNRGTESHEMEKFQIEN